MPYKEYFRPEDHSNLQVPYVLILGVPGVGKSTLMDEIVASNDGYPNASDIVPVGDTMVEKASILPRYGRVGGKDNIRDLSVEDTYGLLAWTVGAQIVRAVQDRKLPILIAHLVYRQKGRLRKANHLYEGAPPRQIFLVQADERQIQSWRREDTARKRPVQSRWQIARHQRVLFRSAKSLAQKTGARLMTIDNRPDNIAFNSRVISVGIRVDFRHISENSSTFR